MKKSEAMALNSYTVQVIDYDGTPLRPCRPARARLLLMRGRAEIMSYKPFTIRLVKPDEGGNGIVKSGKTAPKKVLTI